jgi:uncharacterized membrane protein (DUF2068 family)
MKPHPVGAQLPAPLAGGVRVVALIEAAKGALVLLAGMGAFTLVHRDVQSIAERLVRLFHLNPASHYPQIFLDAAASATDRRLVTLAALALVYAGARFVEAFGLWGQRRWAEWFAVLSGGIYVPIEIYEVWERATWPRVSLLTINVIIVACMALALWRTRPRGAPVPT